MNLPVEQHQQIVQGDDYTAGAGRPLMWYIPEGPNLTEGTQLVMVVGYDSPNVYGTVPIEWTGTMGPQSVTYVAKLSVSHEQTQELSEGCYDYILRATLTDGAVVTLATGKLTVQAEPGMTSLMPAQP